MNNFHGRRVCYLGGVESADVCVQIADFYLHLIGTYYVVVAGIVANKFIIIFRVMVYRQDCGAKSRKGFFFRVIGKGGDIEAPHELKFPWKH